MYYHEPHEKAIWTKPTDSWMGVYVYTCFCGEVCNDISVRADNEEWQYDPENETELHYYVFYMEDGSTYYIREVRENEVNGCTTTTTRRYLGGASKENLDTVIFSHTESNTWHNLYGGEPVTVEGVSQNGNPTVTVTTRNNCTGCDYYESTVEYTECDADGNVLETKTEMTREGVVYSLEHYTYTYDRLGNRYQTYKEIKNEYEWRTVETVYDFDSCSYVATHTEYNRDGSISNQYDNEGNCHVKGSTQYTVKDGESCYDGVTELFICARCEEVYSRSTSLPLSRCSVPHGCGASFSKILLYSR